MNSNQPPQTGTDRPSLPPGIPTVPGDWPSSPSVVDLLDAGGPSPNPNAPNRPKTRIS